MRHLVYLFVPHINSVCISPVDEINYYSLLLFIRHWGLTIFRFFSGPWLVPEAILRCRVVVVAKLNNCRMPSSALLTEHPLALCGSFCECIAIYRTELIKFFYQYTCFIRICFLNLWFFCWGSWLLAQVRISQRMNKFEDIHI